MGRRAGEGQEKAQDQRQALPSSGAIDQRSRPPTDPWAHLSHSGGCRCECVLRQRCLHPHRQGPERWLCHGAGDTGCRASPHWLRWAGTGSGHSRPPAAGAHARVRRGQGEGVQLSLDLRRGWKVLDSDCPLLGDSGLSLGERRRPGQCYGVRVRGGSAGRDRRPCDRRAPAGPVRVTRTGAALGTGVPYLADPGQLVL